MWRRPSRHNRLCLLEKSWWSSIRKKGVCAECERKCGMPRRETGRGDVGNLNRSWSSEGLSDNKKDCHRYLVSKERPKKMWICWIRHAVLRGRTWEMAEVCVVSLLWSLFARSALVGDPCWLPVWDERLYPWQRMVLAPPAGCTRGWGRVSQLHVTLERSWQPRGPQWLEISCLSSRSWEGDLQTGKSLRTSWNMSLWKLLPWSGRWPGGLSKDLPNWPARNVGNHRNKQYLVSVCYSLAFFRTSGDRTRVLGRHFQWAVTVKPVKSKCAKSGLKHPIYYKLLHKSLINN